MNAANTELVGVYIYGLFLEGCAWSNKDGKLVDSEPKKLFHPLPVVYVTGVQVISSAAVEKLFSEKAFPIRTSKESIAAVICYLIEKRLPA